MQYENAGYRWQRVAIAFIQHRLGSHKLHLISPAINNQTERALTEKKTGVVIEVLTGVLTGAVMLALSLLAHVVMDG